jgi:hypothetical protein
MILLDFSQCLKGFGSCTAYAVTGTTKNTTPCGIFCFYVNLDIYEKEEYVKKGLGTPEEGVSICPLNNKFR